MGLLDVFDAPTQQFGDALGFEEEAGLLGDPLDIFGERSDAAFDKASQQQIAQFYAALELLKQQQKQTNRQTKPYRRLGEKSAKFLKRSTGIGGLDKTLSKIMGSDHFGDLVDERTDSIEGMLASGGLLRSGETIEEGAAIPTDLALQLFQMLRGDAMQGANLGMGAVNTNANAGSNYGANATELMSLVGNARADATLGKYQTQQNNISTAGGILAKLFGGFG